MRHMPEVLLSKIDLACYVYGPAVVISPIQIDGVTIPAGFRTDLASTPRILWAVFPPWGRYIIAAALHDYHYRQQQVTRKQADASFLRVMRWYGVSPWRRYTMWCAVRWFGWVAWRRNQKAPA